MRLHRQRKRITGLLPVTMLLIVSATAACAQNAEAPAPVLAAQPPGAVAQWVVMKDALAADMLRKQLETLAGSGIFGSQEGGREPAPPLSFVTNGNYVLVLGKKEAVDANLPTIRLLGYLVERPRAHLMLNLRVVQITGSTNANVVEAAETVRALVEAQREEVVRTFVELQKHLAGHIRKPPAADRSTGIDLVAHQILPSLGTTQQPLTIPAILMLAALDQQPRQRLPERLGELVSGRTDVMLPGTQRALPAAEAEHRPLSEVKEEVARARDWCRHYAGEVRKGNQGVQTLQEALRQPDNPLPARLTRQLQRSLDLAGRLDMHKLQEFAESSLQELAHQFDLRLQRAEEIEQSARQQPEPAAPTGVKAFSPRRWSGPVPALQTLEDELNPGPRAVFQAMQAAARDSSADPDQLVTMLADYASERQKVEASLRHVQHTPADAANFAKLQILESNLNLWLRRVSEAMGRALDEQFYRQYDRQLRLLANKRLRKSSLREILSQATLDQVPALTRTALLEGSGADIFVSNTLSLQFAPGSENRVSAQVQSSLPRRDSLEQRLSAVREAVGLLGETADLQSRAHPQNDDPMARWARSGGALRLPGLDGPAIVEALLAGGESTPVRSGTELKATPSIGFDASTLTLTLTVSQTLEPNTEDQNSRREVADRVTNHQIDRATITALSYEPVVLSTLASHISYYERTGGVPLLRKVPGLRSLLGDLPMAPFKEGSRQKGVYQCSVIILEPVVIPTIEDLFACHGAGRAGLGAVQAGGPEPGKAPGSASPVALPK